MTKIQWTDQTWNPIVGCSMVSEGCTNCYAMRMAARLEAMGQARYAGVTTITGGRPKWTEDLRLVESELYKPRKWKKPRRVFVCSMADLFNETTPVHWINRIFRQMCALPNHTFQVLTKRPENMRLYLRHRWPRSSVVPSHIWLGTSVETADHADRIDHLRATPAAVRFLSLEPLLGPLPNLNLRGIHWVIVGGESGPGARPMDPAWVRDIRDQCLDARVAFFFKQWGTAANNPLFTGSVADLKAQDPHPKGGALLDGILWRHFPHSGT